MSSKNNVNKDFYTIAGRDRPNEDLVMAKPPRGAPPGRRGGPRPNFIPGAPPVGESPAEPETTLDKARPKAGAFGDTRRRTSETKTAKRGTKRAEAAAKRTGAPRRSRRRAA